MMTKSAITKTIKMLRAGELGLESLARLGLPRNISKVQRLAEAGARGNAPEKIEKAYRELKTLTGSGLSWNYKDYMDPSLLPDKLPMAHSNTIQQILGVKNYKLSRLPSTRNLNPTTDVEYSTMGIPSWIQSMFGTKKGVLNFPGAASYQGYFIPQTNQTQVFIKTAPWVRTNDKRIQLLKEMTKAHELGHKAHFNSLTRQYSPLMRAMGAQFPQAFLLERPELSFLGRIKKALTPKMLRTHGPVTKFVSGSEFAAEFAASQNPHYRNYYNAYFRQNFPQRYAYLKNKLEARGYSPVLRDRILTGLRHLETNYQTPVENWKALGIEY